MITPSDTPSSPEDYAAVAVQGMNIQADLQDGEITTAMNASTAVAGAGVLYPEGPRQAETAALLHSPQGYADFDITSGFAGSHGETWPDDPTPPGA